MREAVNQRPLFYIFHIESYYLYTHTQYNPFRENIMKKIFISCISLLLLTTAAILAVSCKEHNDDDDTSKAAETVIMFFPYSSLESSITKNIEAFKKAIVSRGGLGRSRVVVFQTISNGNARMYEIKYDNGMCTDHIIETDIAITFHSNDQQQVTSDIQRILSIVKQHAEAESYSLISGCHGNAWLPAGTYNLNELNSRAFGTSTTNFQIDNSSVVTALLNEGMHLRYILFDACFMSNIETIFEYQEVCDYYISSPTEILAYGMPYDVMGDALLKHNYDEAAKKYHEFYSATSTPYATISVVDCRHISDMVNVMNRIYESADVLTDVSTLQPMEGMKPTVFFDFADYVNTLCTDDALRNEFNSTLQALVPYKYHTPSFYSVFNKKFIAVNSYCGLNTSEPTQHPALLEAIRQTPWHIATRGGSR